eukprot:gnl/MRDRNA2_/MRDRNA2_85042_c0_seq1.p1 gnl/MRDRNA2_/MRDRNA2_85042_c0~~gnl/MRDRNA2_/MRDRNA2_85042_c0_seq1.p1  ORF type:complete len:289 (+),score=36.11 gnl/MRDRNA2_/MRDRNA2_85042_c0_seq1:100-966(+)
MISDLKLTFRLLLVLLNVSELQADMRAPRHQALHIDSNAVEVQGQTLGVEIDAQGQSFTIVRHGWNTPKNFHVSMLSKSDHSTWRTDSMKSAQNVRPKETSHIEGNRGIQSSDVQFEHVVVLTVDTRKPASFTLDGLPRLQIANAGAGEQWHGVKTKPKLLLRRLQNMQASNLSDRIVVFMDGADVLFGGCTEEQLLRDYRSLVASSRGAPVVHGAEHALWPFLFSPGTRSLSLVDRQFFVLMAWQRFLHGTNFNFRNAQMGTAQILLPCASSIVVSLWAQSMPWCLC